MYNNKTPRLRLTVLQFPQQVVFSNWNICYRIFDFRMFSAIRVRNVYRRLVTNTNLHCNLEALRVLQRRLLHLVLKRKTKLTGIWYFCMILPYKFMSNEVFIFLLISSFFKHFFSQWRKHLYVDSIHKKTHILLGLSLIKFVNSIYKYLCKVNATTYDI